MDCHLFCHNELPTALLMVPFVAAGVGYTRSKLRQLAARVRRR